MMKQQFSVLIIDDEEMVCRSLQKILEKHGFRASIAFNADNIEERLSAGSYDVILADIHMPGLSGIQVVDLLKGKGYEIPIVLMTGRGSANSAIDAMRKGAFDYILKPYDHDDLIEILKRAADRKGEKLSTSHDVNGSIQESMIGKSDVMQEVFKQIGTLAPTNISVLIQGETGTGKELVAKALYKYSERSDGPFVELSCAAIPETLLEGELFGYERGAFTGAERRKKGLFEEANGGTLFLDEIGELSTFLQAKLLRVLQEKKMRRLGGEGDIPLDVRLITATNVSLIDAIGQGEFREDVYHRINQAAIFLPALRDRGRDVELLFRNFLITYARDSGLPEPVLDKGIDQILGSYDWPGNIRQLQNVAWNVSILAHGAPISKRLLKECISKGPQASEVNDGLESYVHSKLAASGNGSPSEGMLESMVAELERFAIQTVLNDELYNKSKAAKRLGISRPTLNKKLKDYNL